MFACVAGERVLNNVDMPGRWVIKAASQTYTRIRVHTTFPFSSSSLFRSSALPSTAHQRKKRGKTRNLLQQWWWWRRWFPAAAAAPVPSSQRPPLPLSEPPLAMTVSKVHGHKRHAHPPGAPCWAKNMESHLQPRPRVPSLSSLTPILPRFRPLRPRIRCCRAVRFDAFGAWSSRRGGCDGRLHVALFSWLNVFLYREKAWFRHSGNGDRLIWGWWCQTVECFNY